MKDACGKFSISRSSRGEEDPEVIPTALNERNESHEDGRMAVAKETKKEGAFPPSCRGMQNTQ
jgi:hypothetical protein